MARFTDADSGDADLGHADPDDDSGPRLLAVVLAAGAGSRWTAGGGPGHKLLADHHGHPVVWHAVSAALQSGCDVIVVDGAVDLRDVVPEGAAVVHNEAWADGQSTSLRVAVDEATRRGASGVIVGLGDQPGLSGEAWHRLASEPGDPTHPILIATYGGVRGQPVRLMAPVWPLLPTEGDEGARSLVRVRPDLVREVPCAGSARQLADIDSPEDLRSWN